MATLNSLTKFSLAITATTALGFLAPSANALSLTASSSGTWSNPVGGTNVKYQDVTTETIQTTTRQLIEESEKNKRFKTRKNIEKVTQTTKVETITKDATTGKTSTTSTTSQPTIVSETPIGQATRINNSGNRKNQEDQETILNEFLVNSTLISRDTENQVRWGEGKNGQSGLGFEGVSGLNLDLNEIFEIGTLRHYNNAINAGTAASKVNLGLNLNFSGIGAQTFNFSFNIDETPNVGKVSDCPYYSTAICSDKITFSTPKNVNTFSIADVEYTLQIVGFSQSPNGTPVKDFISQEGGSNSASLYAKITTAPPKRVPESSSGLSLVAFGALAAGSMLNQRQKLKATAKV